MYSYGLLLWLALKDGVEPFGDLDTCDVGFLNALTNEPLNGACAHVRALLCG